MPFQLATPIAIGSTTEAAFKAACMSLKDFYLASTAVPATYGEMRATLNTVAAAFGLPQIGATDPAATIVTKFNAINNADNTWGVFLQSVDAADSQTKYPGVVADFRRDRYGITRVATGSIPAATAAQVGFPSLATFADLFTFTRSSVKKVLNSSATYVDAAVDAPAFDMTNSTFATNFVRNNTGVGAVAGTPGTLPTNWLLTNSPTVNVIGTGVESGIEYIDLQLIGGAVTYAIEFDGVIGATTTTGETWTNSFYIKLVGGSTANMSAIQCAMIAAGSSENFFGTNITPTGTLTRVSTTGTLTTAGATSVRPRLRWTGSGAHNVTLRIGLPQLERGATATDPIRTTGAAVTSPTTSVRQLLLEGASTNQIRNNSGQGAAAGTPGTLPTNWSWFASGGLTTSVVGTGTQNGIDYVDVRLNGTTSSTFATLAFEAAAFVTAAAAQVWATSVFAAIVAGSMTNISNIRTQVRQVGGTADTFETAMSTLTGALVRQPVAAGTLTASASAVNPAITLNFSGTGVAVDITLRIGWPQLEQSSSASSPIRTTTTAVTRAADNCQLSAKALAVLARTAAGVVVQGRGVSNAPSTVGAIVGDATTGPLRIATAGTAVSLGVVVPVTQTATVPLPTFGVAGGWDGSGKSLSYNGAAIATDATTLGATLSAGYLGRAGSGLHASGWYDRFVVYPFRPNNASLVSEATTYA